MAMFVAVLGDRPGSGVRRPTPWGAWGLDTWSDPTVLATDPDVTSPDTDAVLVLSPRAGARQAQVAAALIASTRPDLRLRVEVLPVSLGVLVHATERVLDADLPATGVVAGIAAAAVQTTWGAWLPSVANLETPSPTLGQHVQSWFARGAGFLAVHGQGPDRPGWVAKLPLAQLDNERRLPKVDAGAQPAYDCQAFGDLPEEAIAALFAMGLSSRPTRREKFGDTSTVWGTAKAVEFVIGPAGPGRSSASRAEELRLPPPSGSCPSCGDPVWGPVCAFCRVTPTPAGSLTDRGDRHSASAGGTS